MASIYRIFKKKKYDGPDGLFFALEDLPYLGKEYWFLYFCAPPQDDQVVLTLGRSVESVKVNNTNLTSDGSKRSAPCAAVCWYYSDKKHVVFDSVANVSTGKDCKGKKGIRCLRASQAGSEISIMGSYPKYSISLKTDGKKIFSARAFPPKKGMPYELVHLLNVPVAHRFGAAMVNYYFDFAGKLEGKPLSGKAYLQKVVAVLPLAPWNWVRVHFKNGATLDFFTGKPLGSQSNLTFACNNYFEMDGKRVKLADLSLSYRLSGEKRIWVLSSKNLYCVMETYSLQPFIMKQKTTFRYDEYLVKVRAFAFKDKHKEYSIDDLGRGVGLVEDASGYLI